MDLTTPAVLLSTISLLMLAFTNRFLGLASLVRELHAKYKATKEPLLLGQIHNLRLRLRIIRDMQTVGVFSLFLFVLCMFLIFSKLMVIAFWVFGAGLVLLMLALILSTIEIHLSTRALNIQLKDLETSEPC